MQNFEYYNPTRLIFGRGEIASLTRHIPEGVRVLVTFGGGSVKRNGVYDQVKAALAGIDHVEFWGIEANPKVETLRKCIEFGREQKAGFILAVGGGSVLDGSKLVACALTEGETRDAWDIVLSRRPARCIPYASVMTLPATGSEMNANSVISRLETKEKLAFVAPENPCFSILDPECCRSLGAAQVAASLADITAHVLEQYMTEPGQSRPMDRWAEGLLLTLVDIAPALRTPEPDYDVLADYMLTATLGLNDMICMGVNQDWATHAIGHEITALTGMAHGATLAIVFPALLRVLIDTKEAKLVQMGERVFDVHYGTDRERALETIVRLEAFFASLGLPTRLDEAGVGEDVEREIVRRFEERNWKLGEHKNITPAQIAAILWRYAGSPSAEAGQDFADESSIPAYASAAVDWARANGVVNGTTDNRFDPNGNATRAQVATILRNYLTMTPVTPQPDPGTGNKILVAYFSGSGNTERVAQDIADELGADLFEITPVTPYTSADLDWTVDGSRVNREHDNEALRDIALTQTTPANWDEYDTVFIGYPIWWGIAAWPVNNFVRGNDFSGKTVIPFATSSSSGMGQSGTLLEEMANGGTWQSGQRFSSGASSSTVRDWAAALGL